MLKITARPLLTFGLLVGDGIIAKADAGFSLDLPTLYANATEVTSMSHRLRFFYIPFLWSCTLLGNK
jgi:hypothetical protein